MEVVVTRATSTRSLVLLTVGCVVLTLGFASGTSTATTERDYSVSGATAAARPWAETPLIALPFAQGPVQVPDSRYAYGIVLPQAGVASSRGRLVRIDLAHGHVTYGPEVPSDSTLFAVGASVAVLSAPIEAKEEHRYLPQTLRLVKGTTATLGPSVTLPTTEAVGPLALSPKPFSDEAWLPLNAASSEVGLVDVRTGVLLRSMHFSSYLDSMSPSPDGKLVYIVRYDHHSCPAALALDELAAISARVLAHACIGGVGASLTAVPGGVWASVRTGMHGHDLLYRSKGLVQVMTGLSPGARGHWLSHAERRC